MTLLDFLNQPASVGLSLALAFGILLGIARVDESLRYIKRHLHEQGEGERRESRDRDGE